MNKLKEAALDYAERGWPIFPCRSDKSPYVTNGVLDATTNLDKIEDWWDEWPKANIGLDVTGAGMMVVDLDPGHDIEELNKNVPNIPNTRRRASTPRGGEHWFFALDNGEIVANSASKIAKSVDVRGLNGYVLLAPSRTSDGTYSWTSNGKPAYRSDELLRVCNTAREKSKDRDEWIIEPDQEDNISLAIKWLREDAKIAVEGQGGDSMAYATAAHMKSFGMSEEMAFDLMWEHWNPRCSPPWGADEVDHLENKITNGYQYNTSPPGNVTPGYKAAKTAALFKPVVKKMGKKGNEWTAGRFRVVDREGMKAIKPPGWLIKDFIPQESYVMMFGAPGTFKTFLAIDIAMTIATGIGFDGSTCWPQVMDSGPVLFAAGEGRSNFTSRLQAWEKIHLYGEQVSNFRLMDPVPLITEDTDAFIEAALMASPEGYKLTVIDTVGRAMQGANENSQEHASAFTQLVDEIQRSLGGSVLCLHHSGFSETNRARGSSVFFGDVDTMLRVERPSEQEMVKVSMTKQKDAEAWKNPITIKLEETILSEEPLVKSLVAVRPGKQDKIKVKDESGNSSEREAVLAVIQDAAMDFLEENKLKWHTQNALAQAVACDERVNISSQQLSKKHLISLREDNEKPLSKCWHRDRGKRGSWRWSN